jgi:hypothetical protein
MGEDLENHLPSSPFKNVLFNGVFADETIDHNVTFLSDPMSSSHGLKICLWIPIRVEDDTSICRHEINSQTTSTSRQQETKIGRIRSVEMIYSLATLGSGDSPIESLERQPPSLEIIAEDIEHPYHLRKNQYSMAVPTEALQQLVDQDL